MVAVEVVDDFRISGSARTAVVEVTVQATVTVAVLVGPTRVVGPLVRGGDAVRFHDRALARSVHKAALAARADAFGEVTR